MIKVNKKDSIIDIIVKINHSSDEKIILDFPFGHSILHNYTSLKILKNNTKEKDLIIITSDITAKKLGQKLGIKYSVTKNPDLIKYNYNFFEYSKFLLKTYKKEFINFIFGIKKQKPSAKSNPGFGTKTNEIRTNINLNKKSRIGFFLVGLIISILLFLFVFYFAVNKTYIYISPEVIIKSRSKNLYFRDVKDNEIVTRDNIIKLKKISKVINLKEIFGTSGVDTKNMKKATGEVIFSNKLNETVKLLPFTRLQTSDGILFVTDNSVIIPAATRSDSGAIIPGEVKTKITAKIYDINGEFIGKRANIKSGILLTLPGLKDDKENIYATTKTNISGGKDKYKKSIGKKDVENAKNIFETKLREEALKELKKQIIVENTNNNVTYDILKIDNIIKYSELSITGDENLNVGEYREKFDLSGTITITSFIYNKELVLSKLQNTIKENMLDSVEKLLFIDKDSLRIAKILNREEEPLDIKATTQVEVYMSHNFLYNSNDYIYKLKNSIAGLEKEEAINLLLNNPKISNVKIETRPFFMKKVSGISNNIIFKIVKK